MSHATWSERLSVGNALIDSQHKQLISYLNQLNDAMLEGRETAIIGDLLGKLHGHCKEHFEREELLWISRKYAAAEEHKYEHRDFLVKVLDFNLQLHSGKTINCLEVLVFLRDWFLHHVATSDVAAAHATRDMAHVTASPARFPWRWF
jgi:hemerythrin